MTDAEKPVVYCEPEEKQGRHVLPEYAPLSNTCPTLFTLYGDTFESVAAAVAAYPNDESVLRQALDARYDADKAFSTLLDSTGTRDLILYRSSSARAESARQGAHWTKSGTWVGDNICGRALQELRDARRVPQSPVPQSPVPQSPVPQSPVPDIAPEPSSPQPREEEEEVDALTLIDSVDLSEPPLSASSVAYVFDVADGLPNEPIQVQVTPLLDLDLEPIGWTATRAPDMPWSDLLQPITLGVQNTHAALERGIQFQPVGDQLVSDNGQYILEFVDGMQTGHKEDLRACATECAAILRMHGVGSDTVDDMTHAMYRGISAA